MPFGGCGEFGKNLTTYLHAGRLFVIDAGVKFPDASKLGVDAILPDVDEHFRKFGRVTAYIITHGHEDHIGAMPHLLRRWPAPIYATPWTAELIKAKLNRNGIPVDRHPITVVEAGARVAFNDPARIEFEYVHVNHSIPHSCALFIRTPELNIFHTGDFKYDATPVVEPPMNLARLKQLGDEGVDLLFADSTNADKPGFCPGEASVFEPLRQVLLQAGGAVVVTTFSSNLWRLKTIAEAAAAAGRRIYITGGGLETTLQIAANLGVYTLPPGLRIAEEQDLARTPPEKLVVLATGCQGEPRSAMSRIASREHRHFKISPGDQVVFSSRIIPGNEKSIHALGDELRRQGATIITAREVPGIHVSGHAYGGELELMRTHLRPKMYLPVHGSFSQLSANSAGAEASGHATHLVENGDMIEARRGALEILGRMNIGLSYIDSESGVQVTHDVVRDRLRIGELGCAVLTGVYSLQARDWLAPPEFTLHGLQLPLSVNEEDFRAASERSIRHRLPQLLLQEGASDEETFEEMRLILRRQLAAVLRKKPVVIVKLHLV